MHAASRDHESQYIPPPPEVNVSDEELWTHAERWLRKPKFKTTPSGEMATENATTATVDAGTAHANTNDNDGDEVKELLRVRG